MSIQMLTGLDAEALTRRLVRLYSEQLAAAAKAGEPGRTLWLVPNQRSVREVEQRLLAPGGEPREVSSRVLLAPNIFTFDGFAEAILEQSGRDVTPVSPAFRRLLLRRIVDLGVESGRVTYFRPIASTSGFLDLVERYIAELKREEAWPEVFEAITQSQRPRDRELAYLYREYQQTLHQRQLYDTEGRFWAARQVLAQGGWGRFQRLLTVIVDGFTDFTRTQRDLLLDINEHAESLWISLPGEPDSERSSLFSKPLRVVATLAGEAAVRVEHIADVRRMAGENVPGESVRRTSSPSIDDERDGLEVRRTGDLSPAARPGSDAAADAPLRHLARELFRNPRRAKVLDRAEGIEVMASAGTAGELRAAAERVKRLLREGVRPAEIVVSTRDPSVASRLCRFFDECGIPAAGSTATPLAKLSAVRLLVAMFDLELADWPFEDLLALLHNSCLAPGWPGWDGVLSPVAVGEALRQLKLPGDRAVILETLARRVARADEDTPVPPVFADAQAVVTHLDRELARIREPLVFADWVDRTMGLARDLGIIPPIEWRTSGRESERLEWTGWDLFERSLYGLRRDDLTGAGDESGEMTIAQWRGILGDVLAIETVPPQRSERGRVRILPPEQARTVSCRVLILVGLSESSFPSPSRDDCFFTDSERADLHKRGLSLEPHANRLDDEHLLFWSLVTRPREKLVLSYPLVDGKGSPLSPSPFVTAVRRLFSSTALRDDLNEDLNPLPAADRILSGRDLRLVATHAALDGRAALMSRLAGTAELQSPVLGIAAAMELYTARFHTRGFTRFEGAFAEPLALARIAADFSGEHEFSASQLERFAACPFRFAMEQGGKIAPLEPPVEDTNVARRGVLVHDLLQRLHAELLEGDPGEETFSDRLAPRFRELVAELLGERPLRNDLQAALLRVERRLFHDWAEEYQSQWNQYGELSEQLASGRSRPVRLETAFGSAPSTGESPAPAFAALEMMAESGVIRIGGRIDRIDIAGSESHQRFIVIDYKSGGSRTPRLQEIESGRQLQLALYALAVQRLGLVGPEALPMQVGYWNIAADGFTPLKQTPRSKPQALDEAVWGSLVALLEEVVPRLVAGMRRGEFVVENVDKSCTSACPLATACRVAEVRALPEVMAKSRREPRLRRDERDQGA
jgi:ATP-dependent helicase/nuclease subunit B